MVVSDLREPFYVLKFLNLRIGLLGISITYWISLLGFFLLTLFLAALIGLALYQTVVLTKTTNTLQAYLIGLGIVVPFWMMVWPLQFLKLVTLDNAIFRFLVGGIAPIVCAFRTIEVVSGFCPNYVTQSAKDFCFYYAMVPIVQRRNDGTPIVCENSQKLQHLLVFGGMMVITGLLQSILTPYDNMNVFGSITTQSSSWRSFERLGSWQLYANSALQAMLFQLYLGTYYEALQFAFALLTGYQSEAPMDNPLLESKSPMDFWGKRWNTMIHTVLKNGVYKPIRIRLKSSKTVAVLATFVASGLFHEWILWLVFSLGNENENNDNNSFVWYGGALVFFVWQAMLIGLELALGKTRVVQSISQRMPKPIQTFLVVCMGLPLAHFFLEPYVTKPFFSHGAMGLPMVVVLSK